MTSINKRIDNVMKVMREAKDYECKMIWNKHLQELFEIRKRKAYERLQDQARMVHQQCAGVDSFCNIDRIIDCKYRDDVYTVQRH